MGRGFLLSRSYRAIQSFISHGPALLSIHLSEGSEANLVVESVETVRDPDGEGAPDGHAYSLMIGGPAGHLLLDEDEIIHVQPDGPQEGSSLYISLDNGTELTLERYRCEPM